MFGAIQQAKKMNKGLIVTIFGDHGFKYLSTKLFG
jgi:cysteine synthase